MVMPLYMELNQLHYPFSEQVSQIWFESGFDLKEEKKRIYLDSVKTN